MELRTPEQIETLLKEPVKYMWKIQSNKYNENVYVAYIDSRDVQNALDKSVGFANWQSEFYQVGTNTFCKIGIFFGGDWTWKSDAGTPSDIEAEKGLASDAFKRAAVQWGIGRFLYDLDMVKLPNIEKDGKKVPLTLNQAELKPWEVIPYVELVHEKIATQDVKWFQKNADLKYQMMYTKKQSQVELEVSNPEVVNKIKQIAVNINTLDKEIVAAHVTRIKEHKELSKADKKELIKLFE